MNHQIFFENQWLYPDTPLTDIGNKAVLYAARGSDVSFQVLTDYALAGGEHFRITAEGLACTPIAYQLLPAHVSENSGEKLFTTTDYESVKHFVTRKAPFNVYEITMPLDKGILRKERAAFYVRLNIALDATPGMYEGAVTLYIDDNAITVPVSLKIYNAQVPPLAQSNFHMVNWIYYDRLATQYNVIPYSDEYRAILGQYFENELDMRNDYLMIPSGVPVRDEDGRVIDFDFTNAEYVGNMALEYGFKYIMGGFSARFHEWDEDDHYLLWDREVGVSTIEGFRQLKIYFSRAWECVVRNNWQAHYMQCLVDEPQFPNSLAYRAMSGICRQNMPGVKIHDPVETTEIGGALDVWDVKQAVYEKYLDDYRRLQEMGEEIWLYTCGYPAGATMNRIMDLPLTVSRLPMWLCYKYDAKGFLHWGYHLCPTDELLDGCIYIPKKNAKYPPGNAHVVYTGDGRPWYSLRGHAQRTGAHDYELFYLLGKRDKAKALALIDKVCRSFDDYDGSFTLFDDVRHELLEALG